MAEVKSVMKSLIGEWVNPDHDRLTRGDPESMGQLWNNCKLANVFASAEIVSTDSKVRPEVISLQHDVRKVVLKTMPCLQALMRETASGKITTHHGEMIECAVSASERLDNLIDEACDYLSPELLAVYRSRTN